MANTSKIDITCLNCKLIFSVRKYREHTAKFCSRSCGALYVRIRESTNCNICGKTFEFIASRCNKVKYCSRKCYHKSQIGRGRTKYKCIHCDKIFLDSATKKRKYCSKSCVNKAHKENFNPSLTTVRKSMIRREMINQCNRCGYTKEPRILGVHHKDRNRNNNQMSNLEVLCPNCHSLEHLKHISHGFTE